MSIKYTYTGKRLRTGLRTGKLTATEVKKHAYHTANFATLQ